MKYKIFQSFQITAAYYPIALCQIYQVSFPSSKCFFETAIRLRILNKQPILFIKIVLENNKKVRNNFKKGIWSAGVSFTYKLQT